MIIIFVFATRQILHNWYCPTYAFLCKYFDSMSILCTIFVKLEHFILFNNFDVPQLHVLQDKHKLNGSKAIHVNM